MASSMTCDDNLSANIKSNDPASVAFWEGYTCSLVSSNPIFIIIIFQLWKYIKPFKNKGFKYYDKVSMIIGDGTACGGHVFHLSSGVAPAADEDDNDDGSKHFHLAHFGPSTPH